MSLSSGQQRKKGSGGDPGKGSRYAVRKAKGKYDTERVIELWANLTMIQQMQGKKGYFEECQKRKLDWKSYVKELLKEEDTHTLVIENSKEIFGFVYCKKRKKFFQPGKLVADVTEMYMEPEHRTKDVYNELAVLVQDRLARLGYTDVDFHIKGL